MIRNDCNFHGNLTRDPELRNTKGGNQVANFGMAVRGFKKDEVTFIDCEAWGRDAEYITTNFVTGDKIAISAEYRLDKFTDKNGDEREKPRFQVREVEPLKLKKWLKDDDSAEALKTKKKKAKTEPEPEPDDEDLSQDDDDIPF